MSSTYWLAALVAGIYIAIKLAERSLFKNEKLSIKKILRDGILVGISVVGGEYLLKTFNTVTPNEIAAVSLDEPKF